MNSFSKALDQSLFTVRLVTRRLRALSLRLRGARVGRKVFIGRNVLVEKPWRLVLGDRVQIENDVYIKVVSDSAVVEIGEHTFIGKGSEIDASCSVRIGSHSLIAPGCFITDHSHGIDAGLRIDQQPCTSNPVVIGDDVWIGANSVLLPGLTVENGAVIGATSVVTKNVRALEIAVGVPARCIGSRETKSQ